MFLRPKLYVYLTLFWAKHLAFRVRRIEGSDLLYDF